MPEPLNLYGDRRIETASGHGIDVAIQRADDLDKMALDHLASILASGRVPRALDLASGAGGQALRMAAFGAEVEAWDAIDYSAEIRRADPSGRIRFAQVDLLRWPVNQTPRQSFDVVVFQRAIHYFQYERALNILTVLKDIVRPEGALFISASGIDSELGTDYPRPRIAARFAPLAPVMADKHNIRGPVCLYNPDDMWALLSTTGWAVKALYTSPFGNIKAMAVLK